MQKPPGCLGFTPRSESFAIEPSVQVCSISLLSEFRFAEMSCFATPASVSSTRTLIHWTFLQVGSSLNARNLKQRKSRACPDFFFALKKLPRLDCLDLFALNVSTCFACRFSIFDKSTPHSAHRSLEPKTRLTPCGSRPTLQILVKTKARTSLALILTIKNSPNRPRIELG